MLELLAFLPLLFGMATELRGSGSKTCPDCDVFDQGQWRTGVCDECKRLEAGTWCDNCQGTGSPICCRCEGTGCDPHGASRRPPITLYLIACAAKKHDAAMPAGDIYVSDLFSKSRAYVESQGAPWLILSAEHGLLRPDAVIEPYNVTLNDMRAPERRAWAARVFEQMAELQLRPGDRVIFLAGRKYRDDLIPMLEAQGVQVEVPMLGLGIGHQKQWLRLRTPPKLEP